MVGLSRVLASSWLLPAVYGATQISTSAYVQTTLPASVDNGENLLANIDDPNAINAQSACPGYRATDVKTSTRGLTATLKLAGKACNAYGDDVETLDFTLEYQSASRVNIQITPSYVDATNASWYQLSEDVVPRPKAEKDASAKDSQLDVTWTNEPSFGFKVARKATGDVLFDTTGSTLVYENQFIEFVTGLPQDYNLYGLGEHIQQLRLLKNATLTLYAADTGDPIDQNTYGSHAFYLDTRYYEVNGHGHHTLISSDQAKAHKNYASYSHGVFLRNAHGQEVLLGDEKLTWRTLGGSIDLTFYAGPTQREVTKDYQLSTIGLPAMQQYFTFGYHQCRWGYSNWSQVAEVVANFQKFEIPLENIWNDIDYMKGYRDFENDPERFAYDEGAELLDKLHKSGIHYIPIVDSALYIPNPDNSSDAYDTYTRGAEMDVFLKNPDGSTYIGAPNSTEFWSNELVEWHGKVAFDGIWIDMSEVSSFLVGSCGTGKLSQNPVHPPFSLPGEPGNVLFDYPEASTSPTPPRLPLPLPERPARPLRLLVRPALHPPRLRRTCTPPRPRARNVNHPPYVINHAQTGHDLAVHAVSPNATHHDGVQEYDVHNLFGHSILRATYEGLLKVFPSKRPFIIGRSTFAGTGKWAGHWGGDNASKWAYMFFSIPQALQFSLFGIPMFGVDTCGFNGNTDEELCSRWMQLSAFFPFYRNHNVLSAISQEPYQWASVTEASKAAMKIRYALLPYMYTLFQQAHTTGSTVMRALAWEFPNDPTLAAVDTQFLLGPSLMVVPVLAPQADSVKGVFPGVKHGEVWYDWYTQTTVEAQPYVNTTIPAPLGACSDHPRCPQHPWTLLTALGEKGEATGELYLDDGESLQPNATLTVTFKATKSSLHAEPCGNWREKNPLAKVDILGVTHKPHAVTLNDIAIPASSVHYNSTSNVLSVTGLEKLTTKGAFASSWVMKW
ncbi:Alpha-glucosidase [Penicillium oxalicum]|uniref:Alpha-glucosidase n=1 Tax=Penicillium oxalicum TaxID=69781 RepID=UPI0020B85903|nr:Alpha-glucosidase [Penicillium oxalicum]KAI2787723.1 Alpha-glucosidase [Penicillium oxalicum]